MCFVTYHCIFIKELCLHTHLCCLPFLRPLIRRVSFLIYCIVNLIVTSETQKQVSGAVVNDSNDGKSYFYM